MAMFLDRWEVGGGGLGRKKNLVFFSAGPPAGGLSFFPHFPRRPDHGLPSGPTSSPPELRGGGRKSISGRSIVRLVLLAAIPGIKDESAVILGISRCFPVLKS